MPRNLTIPNPSGRRDELYSRDIFDPLKRYVKTRVTKNIPWVDADANEGIDSQSEISRQISASLGDGTPPNSGLNIRDADSVLLNNFSISVGNGNGTYENRSSIFVKGLEAFFTRDVDFVNDLTTLEGRLLHSRITSFTDTTLSDLTANYAANELVGRTIFGLTITGNSGHLIFVASGFNSKGLSIGDRYHISLTTPSGSNRNDEIWLDVWLAEVDELDDPNLTHPVAGIGIPAQVRYQTQQRVFVRQDSDTFSTPMVDFVDPAGFQHYVLKLADMVRSDGVDLISPNDITLTIPTRYQGPFAPNTLVESLTSNLTWLTAVDTRATTPPISPTTGDRVLIDGIGLAGSVFENNNNNIATFNGVDWSFLSPVASNVVTVKDETGDGGSAGTGNVYIYSGAAWTDWDITIDHGRMLGLDGDDHTQYLLASGGRNITGVISSTASPGLGGASFLSQVDVSRDGYQVSDLTGNTLVGLGRGGGGDGRLFLKNANNITGVTVGGSDLGGVIELFDSGGTSGGVVQAQNGYINISSPNLIGGIANTVGLDINSKRIIRVMDPDDAQDVATKKYVDDNTSRVFPTVVTQEDVSVPPEDPVTGTFTSSIPGFTGLRAADGPNVDMFVSIGINLFESVAYLRIIRTGTTSWSIGGAETDTEDPSGEAITKTPTDVGEFAGTATFIANLSAINGADVDRYAVSMYITNTTINFQATLFFGVGAPVAFATIVKVTN